MCGEWVAESPNLIPELSIFCAFKQHQLATCKLQLVQTICKFEVAAELGIIGKENPPVSSRTWDRMTNVRLAVLLSVNYEDWEKQGLVGMGRLTCAQSKGS